jgi:RNA polymerase-binding protein DksA
MEEIIREKCRQKLEKEYDKIFEFVEKMKSSVNEGDGGNGHCFGQHMADHGTDQQEREKTFLLISRQEKQLMRIEEALERLKNGHYGVCLTCGQEINPARMLAVPVAKHCITCKNGR